MRGGLSAWAQWQTGDRILRHDQAPILAGYDTPVLTSRPDSYTTFVDATSGVVHTDTLAFVRATKAHVSEYPNLSPQACKSATVGARPLAGLPYRAASSLTFSALRCDP